MGDWAIALSSFFYDFVCRLIPGALLFYLLTGKHNCDHKQPIRTAAMVIVMWSIGLTLDIITEGMGKSALQAFQWVTGIRMDEVFLRDSDQSLALLLPNEWKSSLSQAIAYRAFFRLLFVISLTLF